MSELKLPLRHENVEGQICLIDKSGRIRAMCLTEETAAALVAAVNEQSESRKLLDDAADQLEKLAYGHGCESVTAKLIRHFLKGNA